VVACCSPKTLVKSRAPLYPRTAAPTQNKMDHFQVRQARVSHTPRECVRAPAACTELQDVASLERVELAGSHGRWKGTCLQTTLDAVTGEYHNFAMPDRGYGWLGMLILPLVRARGG
jgi:hypothetical protein